MNNIPSKLINDKFLGLVHAGEMEKAAAVATDFTRLTIREEALVPKILPITSITHADCHKQIDTDEPTIIVEKEVSNPLSVSVGYGTLPKNHIMKGSKYRIDIARVISPQYVQDVVRLEGYDHDVRNMFKENAIKDHMTEYDRKFFEAVDAICTQTNPGVNLVSPITGKCQYNDFTVKASNSFQNGNGTVVAPEYGFTVENLVDAQKVLRTGFTAGGGAMGQEETPIRLPLEMIVMNANTASEYMKLPHTVVGDFSTEVFKNGLDAVTNIMGVKHLITLKDDIIKDGYAYYFSSPEYIGKFVELEAPTMFVDKRAFMIEFFLYSSIGCTIGNAFSVAKAKLF